MLWLLACVTESAPIATADPLRPRLRWIASWDGETWEEGRAGLWWALSDLGAAPPADERAVVDVVAGEGEVAFTLDLTEAGFPGWALGPLGEAVAPLVDGDEAAVHGAVDLGRLLMRTLYDPHVYAAVTGACPTLDDWRAEREAEATAAYAVVVSQLVGGHRLVTLNPDPATARDIAMLAAEGQGSLADGTFVASEHETVDLMDNGRVRYAVYGEDGGLRAAASHSPAGQPGKCVWCHEAGFQYGTPENPSAEGYLSYDAFIEQIVAATAVMDARRAEVGSAVDFAGWARVHEWAEWLVEGFLHPSAERVAVEWGVTAADVRDLGLPAHDVFEYGWTERYDRADVDAAWADGEAEAVADSAREGEAEAVEGAVCR